MTQSLIEALPGIIAAGRRQAAELLEHAAHSPGALRLHEEVYPVASTAAITAAGPAGRLIHGDNLNALAALLTGPESLRDQVDFIYIDPPFASAAHYEKTHRLPGLDFKQLAYSDTAVTADYLAMLAPRLFLMRELLAPTGTIYVHIDWHVGHYVKLLLDAVFGTENLINEIIWRYGKMSNTSRRFPQNHDTIFSYAKDRQRYFFRPIAGADSEYRTRYRNLLVDNKVTFGAAKGRADKLLDGRVRKLERELGRPLEDADVLFDFDEEFKLQDDVFYDISIIRGNAAERLHYATQKPVRLLERLLEASCPPGGLVADFFCGSGTTAAVAEATGRRWITADVGQPAITTTRSRLVAAGARPFAVEKIEAAPLSSPSRPAAPAQITATLQRGTDGTVTVELTGYSGVEAAVRAADNLELAALYAAEPLALIEYWAIDTDYDGATFRARWQTYRGADNAEPRRTPIVAKLPAHNNAPGDAGSLRVRAVDIFGHEAETQLG